MIRKTYALALASALASAPMAAALAQGAGGAGGSSGGAEGSGVTTAPGTHSTPTGTGATGMNSESAVQSPGVTGRGMPAPSRTTTGGQAAPGSAVTGTTGSSSTR
jgi:hypothetical protein